MFLLFETKNIDRFKITIPDIHIEIRIVDIIQSINYVVIFVTGVLDSLLVEFAVFEALTKNVWYLLNIPVIYEVGKCATSKRS